MQTTATRTAGSHTDLLTGILNVQVRNEDKITEQDRQYCQLQQDRLYRTLDRIDRWYDIFKEEAERYREIKSFKYEDNGKVSIRNFYFNNSGEDDYTHNEFKPFDLINELADNNCNANANFASRIISYFNRTYNVDVPIPVIDEKAMRMEFRPVYQTYVDMVIEHLGGKSFRETAEEELLARFLKPGDDSMGWIMTILLGIGGSLAATYGGQALGIYKAGEGAGFIGAVVGAVILLVIYGMVSKKN